MLEMFVSLISPHSFNKLLLCYLFFIFTRKALPCSGYSTPSSVLHIWEFALGICRDNLPQEFAVVICRENSPRICRGYLPWVFVYVSKSFFIYVSKFCLYGSKPFLYARKTLFVRFFLLTQFLFVIVVAVMAHRI